MPAPTRAAKAYGATSSHTTMPADRRRRRVSGSSTAPPATAMTDRTEDVSAA